MARRKVNEQVYQKQETAAPKGPGVAKTRGGKPSLLKRDPGEAYRWLRLQPVTKVHAPIRVWARRTADGWEGWLDTVKKSDANLPTNRLLPVKWLKVIWQEVADLKEAG